MTFNRWEKIGAAREVLVGAGNGFFGRLKLALRRPATTFAEMNFMAAVQSKSSGRFLLPSVTDDSSPETKSGIKNAPHFGKNQLFAGTTSPSYSQLVAPQFGLCATYCVFLFTGNIGFDWIARTRLCI
jgi:hypothetical protein